jgi:hypothetical protein
MIKKNIMEILLLSDYIMRMILVLMEMNITYAMEKEINMQNCII